ncbi:MAG: HIT family protein [Myxococcaceae bacterium]
MKTAVWLILLLWCSRFDIYRVPCAFCDSFVIKQQQFTENQYARALWDSKPLVMGHRLIIPKRHVRRIEELTDSEMLAIKKLISELNLKHYWVLQKNDMMQSVPHVHFHIIPKPEGASGFVFLTKSIIKRTLGGF